MNPNDGKSDPNWSANRSVHISNLERALEASERAMAGMRYALKETTNMMWHCHVSTDVENEEVEAADKIAQIALSTDAGKGYVKASEFFPTIKALESLKLDVAGNQFQLACDEIARLKALIGKEDAK